MYPNLANLPLSSTYGDMLHVSNGGTGGVVSALKTIVDGNGVSSCMQISTSAMNVNGSITSTINNIATITDGVVLINAQAGGTSTQWSPSLRFTGYCWTGAAAQEVDFVITNQPSNSGASGNLVISSQVNGGGYTGYYKFSSGGLFTVNSPGVGIGTTTDSVLVTNSTAATAILQQYSGALHFQSQGWNSTGGGATQINDIRIQQYHYLDTAGDTGLAVSYQLGGGGFVTPLLIASNKNTPTGFTMGGVVVVQGFQVNGNASIPNINDSGAGNSWINLTSSVVHLGTNGVTNAGLTVSKTAGTGMTLYYDANDYLTFAVASTGAFTMTPSANTSGAGVACTINGQAALVSSNQNGGNIVLTGGAKDGTGVQGSIVMNTAVTVGPATLASGGNWLTIAGTIPAVTSTTNGINYNVTTTAGTNHNIALISITLQAGYTGNGQTITTASNNQVAGTGTNPFNSGNGAANFSNFSYTNPTTTGHNTGTYGYAANGAVNYGMFGEATNAANSKTNIGVAGFALNTGTTPIQVAGYFGLQSSTPTYASCALCADNGGTSSPVALFRVNGTTNIQFDQYGSVLLTPTATTGTPNPSFKLTTPAHTALTLSTEYNTFLVTAATQQFAHGALTTQRYALFNAPTYTCDSSTMTITTAATLAISGAPIASGGVTITNTYSIWSQSGVSCFETDNIGTTLTDAILLTNTTAATVGTTVQQSGNLHFSGQAWNTTEPATNAVDFQMYCLPATGGTVTGNLIIQSQINGTGGYINPIYFSNTGQIGIGAAPQAPLYVKSSATTNSGGIKLIGHTSSNYIFFVQDLGSNIGGITIANNGADAINLNANYGLQMVSGNIIAWSSSSSSADSGYDTAIARGGAIGTVQLQNLNNSTYLNVAIASTGAFSFTPSVSTGTNGANCSVQAQNGKSSGNTTGGNLLLDGGAGYSSGSGAAGNVSIGSVNYANTGGNLVINQQLWMAGSTSASVGVGTIAYKMPIYNVSGSLLGYLPIYSSIS